MPAMGDSVSEGTVLEWHKRRVTPIAADETLVEISTDKVDAEVPAPIAGTVVKVHAAEGDTVDVGAVLAEIAPTNGAAAGDGGDGDPRRRRRRATATAATGDGRRRRAAAASAGAAGRGRDGATARPSTSPCRRWASRSPRAVLEWAKAARRPGRGRRDDRRDLHRQGRRRGPRARLGHDGRDPRRPPARRSPSARSSRACRRRRAAATAAAPAPAPTSAPRPRRATPAPPRSAGRHPRLARRPPRRRRRRASTSATVHGSGPGRADRQGRRARRRATAARTAEAERTTNGARRAEKPAGATLIKGASAMLARYMDESRSIPTATSFRTLTVTTLDARRKELKEAGHKVSFTHLIAYAIARAATEQMPVMARHFAEIDGKPHASTTAPSTSASRSTSRSKDGGRTLMVPVIRDAGRLSLLRLPRRLQRPDRPRPREQADRRRPAGRERLAHQPRRDRDDRLRSAADDRPGHDRRHRRDRLPAGPRRDRPDDRRREGDDDDVDVRPSHHPGRRVRPVPAGRRGLPAGRARLLRGGLRRTSARRSGAAAAAAGARRRRGRRPRPPPARRPRPRRAAAPTRRCCRPSRPRRR